MLAPFRVKPDNPEEPCAKCQFLFQRFKMIYQTHEGVLHPDGKLNIEGATFPDHPMRVMVTLLDDDAKLAELGDYEQLLRDYEERLASGDIQWQ